MTNFSLVSIPFCLMIADTVGISNLFPAFYLCICAVGIILAILVGGFRLLGRFQTLIKKRQGNRSMKNKFIIGVLFLVQIIYLTEVGTIVIKSKVPLNLWRLFVIFLERTLIAIPLIVLFENLVL